MTHTSINPATGETLARFDDYPAARLETALATAATAQPAWAGLALEKRCAHLRELAQLLKTQRDALADIMTLEMGKLTREARAEVEKCALACEFYAEQAARFLADEPISSDAGKSYVAYQPLGTVFAVMPWNFPFWQVLRFAAPTLAAGNTALLKHAPNVPQCALAIENLFKEAGFPPGVFQTLLISTDQAAQVIGDARVHAVTLTGSERAGRAVAATAGEHLKKCVLELGGSDAFIVLDDADLDWTVAQARKARFQNAGQSCIAAKRFIVVDSIAEEFVTRLAAAASELAPGDPRDDHTTLGPMAREDLRAGLHTQVRDALQHGARAVCGGAPLDGPGYYYPATVLDGITPAMRAWREELFGPVASVIRVKDEAEALQVANGSPYGLGSSVWTRDTARGEAMARQLAAGSAFVNGMVKSDPRLPFGGVKQSGYGRELSQHGIREFVNAKTVWLK